MSSASLTASLWTKVDASSCPETFVSSHSVSSSPAARSGHAMTFLPSTKSVLLFGGADGKIFFEDVFLLVTARYKEPHQRSGRVVTRSTKGRDEADEFQWKRLGVSHGPTCTSQLPCAFLSLSATSNRASPERVEVERCVPTFVHPGGGRDYHTMHYVQSSVEDESTQGMRVLVIGNVVVASGAGLEQCARGTQVEGGAANTAMAFEAMTLRVEELRVRQPMLEAQWEPRRMDSTSMWNPRARHAHSSVVVGGDQVFVFGGKDAISSTFFNDMFYYDSSLNQWVKPTLSPTGQLPQPRAFAGLTASDDGNTLFLFGGTDGKQEFGSLFLYDIVHSRWDSLAGATMGDRPACRINHSLTFVTPCHLVLFGGRRRAVRENELYIYNVSTRTWRLIHGGQSENLRPNHRRCSQTSLNDKSPVGRTAHATVLFHADPAGPNAVQKLLVFGGYAGSHQWLDDLYLLSLSETILMHPPSSSRSISRSVPATQCARPTRVSLHKARAASCVAFPAPQQLLQARQSSQPIRLQEESIESARPLSESVPPIEKSPQSSHSIHCSQKQHQPDPQPVGLESSNPEQSQSVLHSSTAPIAPASCPPRIPLLSGPSRPGGAKRAITVTGSGILSDITNHTGSIVEKRQQHPLVPRISDISNARDDDTLSGAVKKHKRRRHGGESQDSNNSNSSNENGKLTTVQAGIRTTLLQLMQHQPRMEDTLARILSMLTREQTARQQQSTIQENLMRVYSEEQSKRLEAASRRNEALEGRLASSEAERASLHEKLTARETELYMYKQSLKVAIPLLNERVQAIESSHMQQLNVSRDIELKLSAVHDFMNELRNAGGEGTEVDDFSRRPLGAVWLLSVTPRLEPIVYGPHISRLEPHGLLSWSPDDFGGLEFPLKTDTDHTLCVTTQPTCLPPKPLLYPQHVVLALKEKIRAIQLENEALVAQLEVMAEKLKRVEGREAQARQFLFAWCQGDDPPPAAVAAMSSNATTTVPARVEATECESVNTGTDRMTNTIDS